MYLITRKRLYDFTTKDAPRTIDESFRERFWEMFWEHHDRPDPKAKPEDRRVKPTLVLRLFGRFVPFYQIPEYWVSFLPGAIRG